MLRFVGQGVIVFQRPPGEGLSVKAVLPEGQVKCPLGDGHCSGLQLVSAETAYEGVAVEPLPIEGHSDVMLVCGLKRDPTETGSVRQCHGRVGGPECRGIVL